MYVSGIATALTGVGLPVGATLAALGAFSGISSVLVGVSVKRVYQKLDKHEKIVSLAREKLAIIHGLVSKALEDGKISHEEFLLVKSEVEKYEVSKREIQTKKKVSPEVESGNAEEIKRQIAEEMDRLKGLFSKLS